MWALRSEPLQGQDGQQRYPERAVEVRSLTLDGRLMRTQLQLSMHCRTSEVTRCNILHSGLQSSRVGITVVDGSGRCLPPCSHVAFYTPAHH